MAASRSGSRDERDKTNIDAGKNTSRSRSRSTSEKKKEPKRKRSQSGSKHRSKPKRSRDRSRKRRERRSSSRRSKKRSRSGRRRGRSRKARSQSRSRRKRSRSSRKSPSRKRSVSSKSTSPKKRVKKKGWDDAGAAPIGGVTSAVCASSLLPTGLLGQESAQGVDMGEAIRQAQLKAAEHLRNNTPPPPADMRPGDWFCPNCTIHNYKTRPKCFRCHTAKPGIAINPNPGNMLMGNMQQMQSMNMRPPQFPMGMPMGMGSMHPNNMSMGGLGSAPIGAPMGAPMGAPGMPLMGGPPPAPMGFPMNNMNMAYPPQMHLGGPPQVPIGSMQHMSNINMNVMGSSNRGPPGMDSIDAQVL